MTAHATIPYIEVESSLAAVLARLEGHDLLPLAIEYDGRAVQAATMSPRSRAARS